MKITQPTTSRRSSAGDDTHPTTGGPLLTDALTSRSSSRTTPVRRSPRLPGSPSATSGAPRDWGARAAHIRSVTVEQEDRSSTQVMLWLPQGMLDHPQRNTSQLSGQALADEVKMQLDKLPAHAAVRRDGSGDIEWILGGRGKLEVLFKDGGQITSLLLRTGHQTLQLSDQEWLRGALRDAGTTVPKGASLWRVPGGAPVACNRTLPLQTHQIPQALKDATENASTDDLMQQALDALCDGSARHHRSTGAGRAQFEFEVFGQVISAKYQHADHAVHSLQLSWQPPQGGTGSQPLAQWGGLDELVLNLARQGEKRKRDSDYDYSSGDDAQDQRHLEAVMGHRTQIMDFAGTDHAMDTTLDELLGSTETSSTRAPSRPKLDKGKAPAIEATGSRSSSPSVGGTPMSRTPSTPSETRSSSGRERSSDSQPCLPPLSISIPTALLSYAARASAMADEDLKALADCLMGRPQHSTQTTSTGSSGSNAPRPQKYPAFNMPGHMRQFLEAVLQGDGTAIADAHHSVRIFEKTFPKRYSELPATVRAMDGVSAAARGRTTVQLLAIVRPDRSDRFVDVRPYSAANVAAMNATAQSGSQGGEMQPLPRPAQINDTLGGLFHGDANASLLRLLALLQTPGYGVSYQDALQLRVTSTPEGRRHIAGVTFVGQDDGLDDDAPDNDWKRIVEPWLAQTPDDGNLVVGRSRFTTSFKALAKELPSLAHMLGRGQTALHALEGAAAAGLEAAGVEPRFLMRSDDNKTTVLKIGHVGADGSCPPANLSDAARSAMSAFVACRLKSMGHLPPDIARQQPLFMYSGISNIKAAIDHYWKNIGDSVAQSGFSMDPRSTATLPQPSEINSLLGGLFVNETHPELKRAWARLRLPPYCLSETQIDALKVSGGEIVALQGGLYVPLRIVGRNDGVPDDSADNDWVHVFKPYFDVLTANGTQPLRYGDFNRESNDPRSGGDQFRSTIASQTMAALTGARPELGFLADSEGPSDAIQELAAAKMLAAGADPRHLGGPDVLKVSDVAADGSVTPVPDLSADAKGVLLAWKQLCEREGRVGGDALFQYPDPGSAKAAALRHQRRLRTALAGTVAPTASMPAAAAASSHSAA